MSWKKIGSFLKRRKDAIQVDDALEYKRITIKTKHQGVFLRDESKGSLIGTKLQFKVKAGQFLLSKIDARLGAFGIVPDELDGAIITGNFWAFDVDKSKVRTEWLNLFTSSGNFYEICNQASSGTTHRKYLDEKTFLSFEIELPSLEEQNDFLKRFNEYKTSFDLLNIAITQQQSYLALLRQAILQEAVQGKLTKQDAADEPASGLLKRIKAEKQMLIKEGKLKREKELLSVTNDEVPFVLPKGWVWCRLGEVVTSVDYGTSEKATQNGEIPILRMGNVQEEKVVLSNLKYVQRSIKDLPRLFLKKGDVVFNRTNSYELVGKSGIFKGEDETYTLASYLIRISVPHQLLSVSFVNYYINSSICRETQIEPQITQQTGQANFSGSKLKVIVFPLPPLAEQQRIVTKVQQLQHQLGNLETQVRQSSQYAKQLLQTVLKEAFSAKAKQYEINEELSLAAEP